MPYTDETGLIYDDDGRVIGATPRSYKTPEGTWNFYPNKKAVQQRMPRGAPDQSPGYDVDMSGDLGSGDNMQDHVNDIFGFSQSNGRARRGRARSSDPFDFSSVFG